MCKMFGFVSESEESEVDGSQFGRSDGGASKTEVGSGRLRKLVRVDRDGGHIDGVAGSGRRDRDTAAWLFVALRCPTAGRKLYFKRIHANR